MKMEMVGLSPFVTTNNVLTTVSVGEAAADSRGRKPFGCDVGQSPALFVFFTQH